MTRIFHHRVPGRFALATSIFATAFFGALMYEYQTKSFAFSGTLLIVCILAAVVCVFVLAQPYLDLPPNAFGWVVFATCLLLALTLATPKKFKHERRRQADLTRISVSPIWNKPKGGYRDDEFAGLSTSVVFAEALGAAAIGLLAWALTHGRNRRRTSLGNPKTE